MCVDKEEQYKALNKLPILSDKKKFDNSKIISKETIKENETKFTGNLEKKFGVFGEKALQKEEKKPKLVKKVNFDDISKTVYELKLRFILKKIDVSKIDKVFIFLIQFLNNFLKYLFNEKIQSKGYATIFEIKESLQKLAYIKNLYKN